MWSLAGHYQRLYIVRAHVKACHNHGMVETPYISVVTGAAKPAKPEHKKQHGNKGQPVVPVKAAMPSEEEEVLKGVDMTVLHRQVCIPARSLIRPVTHSAH